jgi:hypothetical protein
MKKLTVILVVTIGFAKGVKGMRNKIEFTEKEYMWFLMTEDPNMLGWSRRKINAMKSRNHREKREQWKGTRPNHVVRQP